MKNVVVRIPQSLGVRQPSGAWISSACGEKGGRGLPQSKTLVRLPSFCESNLIEIT